MEPLKANEIYGNWATVLLPIKPDESIDYEILGREIDILLAAGVNGIYSNGTAGEFFNQTEEEFDKLNSLLADKCNTANRPFQIGCSHMSPIISLERLKRVAEFKPSALQVILPDWNVPSMKEILHFLEKMAKIADPVGLVLYNPPHSKKVLSPEDFGEILREGIPLVGCKVAGGDRFWYAKMKEHLSELSLFVPGHHLATGLSMGAHGSYSNIACLNPQIAQEWYQSMKTDMAKALQIEMRINLFLKENILPYLSVKSNTAVDKFLAAVGGWMNLGTRLRWPYEGIGEDEVKRVRIKCKEILPEFYKKTDH